MKTNITSFLVLLFIVTISSLSYAQVNGNGSDGALTVSSPTVYSVNTVASAVTLSNPVGSTMNVASSAGFSVGDAVLVMQMDGTNAGVYNETTITGIVGNVLTFSSPTTVVYSGTGANKAQVIRIPQYTTVTVNSGATLTSPAWNGSTGGVLIYYANGTVTINGTQTMDGKGFSGGTGGTGNAAGTGTGNTAGSAGTSSGAAGTTASPSGGAAGGTSAAGDGGNGGGGNIAAVPTNGISGNGSGAGSSGVAGTNLSSGLSSLLLGGGGGGGQGGQGGQYGGSGGGGGAASLVALGIGKGSNGSAGTAGTASTGVGGSGGTGGGIIFMRVASIAGNGLIASSGTTGSNGVGTGGNGGNGGNGGDGGEILLGGVLTNGGGGGGGGKAGKGGQGPGGGGGGGAGVIAIITGTTTWAGTMTNNAGVGGTGGTGGTSGTSGTGGAGGGGWLLGSPGSAGTPGGAVAPGLAGPNGVLNAAAIPPIVLPVALISFNGTALTNLIKLGWQTAQEKNNAYFIIEKSEDGKQYKELKKVNGQIFSNTIENYSIDDASPVVGNNYYRLKQMDVNGNLTILKVIVVNFAGDVATIALYPNPVGDDRTIHLQYNSEGSKAEKIKLVLYDQVGKIVKEEEASILNNGYTFYLSQDISAGIYYVNIISDTINNKSEKLVVR